jgi:hypothetical protein
MFELADWQLGLYAATLPEEATVYLTPNQQKMATIYFALEGAKERLRSFHSPLESLTPAGQAGETVIYLIRPYAAPVLDRLTRLFPAGLVDNSAPSFFAFWLPEDSGDRDLRAAPDLSWGGAIALRDWSTELTNNQLLVNLTWQTIVDMTREYTVFVHLLAQEETLISQNDRPPDGYPTTDWQPDELIMDTFQIELPEDLEPGTYRIQSGFYHLPTLERLGEPLLLGEVTLP